MGNRLFRGILRRLRRVSPPPDPGGRRKEREGTRDKALRKSTWEATFGDLLDFLTYITIFSVAALFYFLLKKGNLFCISG